MPAIILRRLGLVSLERCPEHRARRTAVLILLSFLGAAVTGLMAQVRLPLPGTPVPLTGQVLAVLLCGALLGSGYGLLSQVIYVVLGVAGVPWLAGGAAGLSVFAGPTGGYLLGFVVAALFLGALTERSGRAKTLPGQLALMLAAVAIIWFFGVIHLLMVFHVGLTTAFIWGVAPFVAADVVKAALASAFASAVLARRP